MTSMRGGDVSLAELFTRRLDSGADDPYVTVAGQQLTALEVARASAGLIAALEELGLERGARVATLLDNNREAVTAWWACLLSGLVHVPVNTANHGEFLLHQLADCDASVLVLGDQYVARLAPLLRHLPQLRHLIIAGDCDVGSALPVSCHPWPEPGPGAAHPAVAVAPGDPAAIIYTGGTTGPAKGCLVSHNYLGAMAWQVGVCWSRQAADVVWTPLPLFHVSAVMTALVGQLSFGGQAVIERRFSLSDFWPAIARCRATIASILGSMATLVARDPRGPQADPGVRAAGSLRLIGAVPLPPDIDDDLRARFGVETFSGAYGCTEAANVSWSPPGTPRRPYAAGVINSGYFEVMISGPGDEPVPTGSSGEILVRPTRPHVMFDGYWRQPQATLDACANLWFHTGDIGRVDAEGYLYFVDRKHDYLRRRGENVSSAEVEGVLLGHPDLAEVAVHAIASPLGEDDMKVTAVRRAGSPLTEAGLAAWCRDRLPRYALPRYVEFRDELPRNPVGRVLKRVLRDQGVTAGTWDADAAPSLPAS